MSYFEDLTPYGYILNRYTEQPDAVNVGWLEYAKPFPKSDPDPELVSRLYDLARRPVNLCRGSHACQFCSGPRPQGNGEIRVLGADGVVYAAPVLVAHYVAAHHYAPPAGFIEAVLNPDRV